MFQVGVMLARSSDAVRLCLTGLVPTSVVPFLEGLGWRGDAEELRALVAELASLVDHLAVDIDVANGLLGKVGLECYLPLFGQPGSEPRWREALDHLVGRRLCTVDQRDTLLGYPGFAAAGPKGGPVGAAALLGSRATSGYARVLHHVKVTCAPDAPVEAKAYVGAAHHWLTNR